MDFEEVSIETILAQDKPEQATTSRKPSFVTKEYHVIDPDTGQLVGTIDAPLDFCNPLSCEYSKGKRNPMGYVNPLNKRVERRDLWVHEHCLRPTLAWWDGNWHRLVLPVEGVKLPWQ